MYGVLTYQTTSYPVMPCGIVLHLLRMLSLINELSSDAHVNVKPLRCQTAANMS